MSFIKFIEDADILISIDDSMVFWIKKSFPNLSVQFFKKDIVIDFLNGIEFDIKYFSNKTKFILTEVQTKALSYIDSEKVYVLKDSHNIYSCLKFDNVLEEAKYISNKIQNYESYYVASNNSMLCNTLLAMSDDLCMFNEYKLNGYQMFTFIQISKLFFNLNRNYENSEIMKLYSIDKVYIGILNSYNLNVGEIWSEHKNLISKLNIAFLNSCVDKFGVYIKQYCNENISNNDYINLLIKIINKNEKNSDLKSRKYIVPLEAIPWINGENLHIASIANTFGENDRIFINFCNNFVNYEASYYNSIDINTYNIMYLLNNNDIKKENNKCVEKSKKTDLKCKFSLPTLNRKLKPLKSYEFINSLDDIILLYTKSILSLKSMNYSIEENISMHVQKIIFLFLDSFGKDVVFLYFEKNVIPLLDKLKIMSKVFNLIEKINVYIEDKSIQKYKKTKYIKSSMTIKNNVLCFDISSYYDYLFLNGRNAIIFKFIYDSNFLQSHIVNMRNMHVNVLILSLSKMLHKHNICTAEICFITSNGLFFADIGSIDLYDLENKLNNHFALTSSKPHFQNIDQNYRFLNLMRSYDNLG